MQISASSAFFATLGVALIGALLVWVPRAHVQPNIVIITIDSLRADHMGIYGYDKPTTPFLDSLFRQGVVFKNAYAPGYLTFQNDASLLSGLYPSEHNMRTWSTPLNGTVSLLPDVLKLYGYSTNAVVSQALREYFGLVPHFDSYKRYNEKNALALGASDVVRALTATNTPAFVLWNIYNVHVPFNPPTNVFYPGPYVGLFAQKNKPVLWSDQSVSQIAYADDTDTGALQYYTLTPIDVAYLRAAYDSGVRSVDDQLRDFFNALKRSGNFDNTIFVITAEHGDDLKEHGFIFHRDVYDVNTHVPLAIIYPNHLLPHTIVAPVTLIDLAPTLTALAEVPVFSAGDGMNLVPLMRGGTLPQRDLFIERPPFEDYALIRWPYKYIVRSTAGTIEGLGGGLVNDFFIQLRRNDVSSGDELYDLMHDPAEQHNLIGTGIAAESTLKAETTLFGQRMRAARQQSESVKDVSKDRLFYTYP